VKPIEELVFSVRKLLHYETTGADEDPTHLYWEEHYEAMARALARYDESKSDEIDTAPKEAP
jgi:hypothetical protein